MRAQRGIAIGLLLAALFLMGMLGTAITYSLKTGQMSGRDATDLALAGALLYQAQLIRDGIEQMGVRGWVRKEYVSLDASVWTAPPGYDASVSALGLYTQIYGKTQPQLPPRDALAVNDAAAAGYGWRLKVDSFGGAAVQLNGVGTQDGYDRVLSLTGLTDGVCRQLNRILNGTSLATAPVTLAPGERSGADWNSGPSATLTFDLRANTGITGPAQCVITSDGWRVFFYTLEEG